MGSESADEILRRLSEPARYPNRPPSVEVVQTHISWVFLAGDEVFKVKKPVRFSFLDFSTLALRQHFCREEVRLNRRLAPDVYLGVVGLRRAGEQLAWCADDDPGVEEVAVRMRRLPADRLLPELLRRGACGRAEIEVLVERLVTFHRAADDGPEVRAAASPEALRAQMDLDFVEMDGFRNDTLAAIDDDTLRHFLRQRTLDWAPLLRARQEEGRIRDGHGDLHAEHIWIPERHPENLIIFDCIEFRPEFRYRDVAGELAFLSMDLEYRGHADLAAHLVRTYAARAGDPELPRLVPFYACHRAYIRGKVDSLKSRANEVDEPERVRARLSAQAHFALALHYTWADAAMLVVVCGTSGSGKSTLARQLAARTGFLHLSSDAIRKELAGLPPTSRAAAGDERGIYGPQFSARTYATMYARAWDALADGRGVILDATFQRQNHRDAARRIARDQGVPGLFVECVCSEEETIRRLTERQQRDTDVSDADVAVYRAQRASYETFAEAEAADHLQIDTETTPGEVAVHRIEATLRARSRCGA